MKLKRTKTAPTTSKIPLGTPRLSLGRRDDPYDFPASPEKTLPKPKTKTATATAKPVRTRNNKGAKQKKETADTANGSDAVHATSSVTLGSVSDDAGPTGAHAENAAPEPVAPRKSGRLAGEKVDLSSVQWNQRPENARSVTPAPAAKRKATEEPSSDSRRPQKAPKRASASEISASEEGTVSGDRRRESRGTLQPMVVIPRNETPKSVQDTPLQRKDEPEDAGEEAAETGSHVSPADQKPQPTSDYLASTPVRGPRHDPGSSLHHHLDEETLDIQSSPPKRKTRRKVDKLAGINVPEVVQPSRAAHGTTGGAQSELPVRKSTGQEQQTTVRADPAPLPSVEEVTSPPQYQPAATASHELPESTDGIGSVVENVLDDEAAEIHEVLNAVDQDEEDSLAQEEMMEEEAPENHGHLTPDEREGIADDGNAEDDVVPLDDQHQDDTGVEEEASDSATDASFQVDDNADYEDKLDKFLERDVPNILCQTESGEHIRKECRKAIRALRTDNGTLEQLCRFVANALEKAVDQANPGEQRRSQLAADAFAVLFSYLGKFLADLHEEFEVPLADTITNLEALDLILPLIRSILRFYDFVSAWGAERETSAARRRRKEVRQQFIEPLQRLQDQYQVDHQRCVQAAREKRRREQEEQQRREEEEQRRAEKEQRRIRQEQERERRRAREREAAEQRVRQAQQKKERNVRKRRWQTLHLKRMECVTSDQDRNYFAYPSGQIPELDANGVLFVREGVFGDRTAPPPSTDNETVWTEAQENALLESLITNCESEQDGQYYPNPHTFKTPKELC